MSTKDLPQKRKPAVESSQGTSPDLIHVPEWGFLEEGRMPLDHARRHFLIFGETGSGKTRSGILPLLSAWVRFGAGLPKARPGMLIIDPKNEIGPYLSGAKLPGIEDILIDFEASRKKVDLFEGRDRTKLSPEDVVEAIGPLTSLQQEKQDPRNTFWAQLGERLLTVAIDGVMRRSLKQGDSDKNENYFKKTANFLMRTLDRQKVKTDEWEGITRDLAWKELEDLGCRGAAEFASMADNQYSGVLSVAMNYLKVPASETFARYIWCNPLVPPGKGAAVSILEAMEEGRILLVGVLDRKSLDAEDAVGKVIKGLFFRFTFLRKDMNRPLVYACDEFQRFITGDEETGEQSYIDRCRAMNVSCIMATQSPNSLLYALRAKAGSVSPQDSFRIICDNTANKFFFRTTNPVVREELRMQIPIREGLSHVLDVRPPASLEVGECYGILSNGRWGIWRINIGGGTQGGDECPG